MVIRVAGPTSFSVAFILLIKFLLALPSLERLIGVRLSYNDEMKQIGLAYVLSGVILTSGAGYSINSMALVHKTGAKRLPAIFAGATNLLFVFFPGVMTYVPKFVLAALVLSSGVEVVEKSLYLPFRKMPRIEYFGVVCPMMLLPFFVPGGVPVSIAYGLLVCSGLFIYENKNFAGIRGEDRSLLPSSYAKLTSPRDLFVKFHCPGFHRSRVVRPASDVALLSKETAPLVSVIRLSGPLFFATTLLLSNAVKTRHRLAREMFLQVRFLIVDFTFATSLDTSAAQAISELLKSSAVLEPHCTYCLTNTTPNMRQTLMRAGVVQERWWHDWDHCMEWVEECLLEELKREEEHDSTRLLGSHNDFQSVDASEWFSRESWDELVREMCAEQLSSACDVLKDLFPFLHPVSVAQGKLLADEAQDDGTDFSLLFLYSGTIESSSALKDRLPSAPSHRKPEAYRLRDELTEAEQLELFPLSSKRREEEEEQAEEEAKGEGSTLEELEQRRRISKRGRGHVLNICKHMGVAGVGGSSNVVTTTWAASPILAFGLRHQLVEGVWRDNPVLFGCLYQLLTLQLAHRYENAKADTARLSSLVRWR